CERRISNAKRVFISSPGGLGSLPRMYGPRRACIFFSSPSGRETAAMSHASDGSTSVKRATRQYSGMRKSTAVAPTLTGQPMLAVDKPASCAACHSVGTRICCAYQYQALEKVLLGSNSRLL